MLTIFATLANKWHLTVDYFKTDLQNAASINRPKVVSDISMS